MTGWLACSGSPAGPTPPPPPPPPPPVVNNLPVIRSISVSLPRVEVEQDVNVVAEVEDTETSPDQMTYEWSAPVGTFSGTGRAVHNEIDARFRFEDGLIAEHTDSFDLWRWARQALGPVGVLLGWSPPVQAKIRSQARASLEEFRR